MMPTVYVSFHYSVKVVLKENNSNICFASVSMSLVSGTPPPCDIYSARYHIVIKMLAPTAIVISCLSKDIYGKQCIVLNGKYLHFNITNSE